MFAPRPALAHRSSGGPTVLLAILLLAVVTAVALPSSASAKDKPPGRQLADLNAVEDKAHAKATKARREADKLGDRIDNTDGSKVSPKQWNRAMERYDELDESANEAEADYESAKSEAKAARDKWTADTASERAEHEEALKNPDIDPCNRALSEAFIKAHDARQEANENRDNLDNLDNKADKAIEDAEKALEEYEKREGQDRRVQEGTLNGRVSDAKSAVQEAKDARRNSKKLDRRANSLERKLDRARAKAARSKICNPDPEPEDQAAIGSDANPVSTTLNPEHRTIIYLGENIDPQEFIQQHGLNGARILSVPPGVANGVGSMISVADSSTLQNACATLGTSCESDHCQEFLLPDDPDGPGSDADEFADFEIEYTAEELAEQEEFNRQMNDPRSQEEILAEIVGDDDDDEGDSDGTDSDASTPTIGPGKWLVMAGTGWSKAETPLDPGSTSGGDPGTTGGEPGTSGGEPGTSGGDPGTTGGEPGTSGGEPGGYPGNTGGGEGPSTPISVNPDDLKDDTFDEMDNALSGEDGGSNTAGNGGEDGSDGSSIDEGENGGSSTDDGNGGSGTANGGDSGTTTIDETEQALIDEVESQTPGTLEHYEAAADFYRYKIKQAETGQTSFPAGEDYINYFKELLEGTLTHIQTIISSDTPKYYELEKEMAENDIEETSISIDQATEDDPVSQDMIDYLEDAVARRNEADSALTALEQGRDPDLPFIPIGSTTTREQDEEETDDGENEIAIPETTSKKGGVKNGAGVKLANVVIVLFPQGPTVAQAIDNNPSNDPEWDDGPLVKTETDADGNYGFNIQATPDGAPKTQQPTDKTMATSGGSTPVGKGPATSGPTTAMPSPTGNTNTSGPGQTTAQPADPFANTPNIPTKAYEPS